MKQFHRILLEKELFSSWRRLLTFAQQLFLISILSKKEKNNNNKAKRKSLRVRMVINNSSRQRRAARQGPGKPLLGLNVAGPHRLKQNWHPGGRAVEWWFHTVIRYYHGLLLLKTIKLLHLTKPTDKSISKRLGDLFATQKSEISQWN